MDDTSHVWNDLKRREDALKWGGHPPGLGAQYDSLGQPADSRFDSGGGWLHEQMGRVERVRRALQDSGPAAQSMATQTLAGISLAPVWPVLVSACQDIALYESSAVAAGAYIGGAGGKFFGGVSACCAAVGGQPASAWVINLLGLPSLADRLTEVYCQ